MTLRAPYVITSALVHQVHMSSQEHLYIPHHLNKCSSIRVILSASTITAVQQLTSAYLFVINFSIWVIVLENFLENSQSGPHNVPNWWRDCSKCSVLFSPSACELAKSTTHVDVPQTVTIQDSYKNLLEKKQHLKSDF